MTERDEAKTQITQVDNDRTVDRSNTHTEQAGSRTPREPGGTGHLQATGQNGGGTGHLQATCEHVERHSERRTDGHLQIHAIVVKSWGPGVRQNGTRQRHKSHKSTTIGQSTDRKQTQNKLGAEHPENQEERDTSKQQDKTAEELDASKQLNHEAEELDTSKEMDKTGQPRGRGGGQNPKPRQAASLGPCANWTK